jgi:hypothetical protein
VSGALTPDAASQLDALAIALLARATPLRVDVARTDAEQDALFRLRGRIAVANGWMRPDELTDGRECDAFDADAIQIGAWLGDELLGTARAILPAPGRRLPVEMGFGLVVEPAGRVAELSRIAVVPGHGERRHAVLLGLTLRAWLEGRARGIEHWAGALSPAVARLYRQMGFANSPLGPAVVYDGVARQPIRYDGPASASALIQYVTHQFGSIPDSSAIASGNATPPAPTERTRSTMPAKSSPSAR